MLIIILIHNLYQYHIILGADWTKQQRQLEWWWSQRNSWNPKFSTTGYETYTVTNWICRFTFLVTCYW